MSFIVHRALGALFLCAGAACASWPGAALADEIDDAIGPGNWRAVISPFSHHFRYSAEHRYVWALGVERQRPDDWMAGASYFRNSFGQPSGYVYVGKRFPALLDQPQFYGQLSGGLMYGYRGEWKNKVPLNYKGFSPGALATLGWQFDKTYGVAMHLLGDAGVMVQFSMELK